MFQILTDQGISLKVILKKQCFTVEHRETMEGDPGLQ